MAKLIGHPAVVRGCKVTAMIREIAAEAAPFFDHAVEA